MGYVGYEGMLVTIKPAAKFAVTALDTYGGFTGAGAHFDGSYRYVYSTTKTPLPIPSPSKLRFDHAPIHQSFSR